MRFFRTNGRLSSPSVLYMAWSPILLMFFFHNNPIFSEHNGVKSVISSTSKITDGVPPVSLNCINNTNISISETGQTVLNPGYFVSPSYPNFPFLILTIQGRSNTIITCDDVGQTLTAMVFDPITNESCSSQFTVEDKLPPVFVCQTLELPCGIDVYSTPPPYTPLVTVNDNCTNPPNVTILSHQEKVYNCPSPYTFEIVREYLATDASGNSATCKDTVRFLRPVLSEIVFPADTSINCDVFSSDTSVTGQPMWRGYPLTGVCYTWFNYTDQLIPTGCAGKFSIRRTWNVMDECTDSSRTHVQCIKSIDTIGPVVVCPGDITIPTNNGSCVATYTFQGATATDNCSSTIHYNYKVDGLLVFTSSVNLPVGNHTIEVIADDGCYNYNSCTYTVTVVDQQGPSLTCHDIAVGLNNMNIATVCADSMDFDYYDNCAGPLTIAIKKSTSSTWSQCVTYDCSEVGSDNILQFRVCDQYGNCTICEYTVEVQDKEAPVIDCGSPAPVELTCADFPGFNPGNYSPNATDNCGTPAISWTTTNNMNCNYEGDYIVHYTATDGSGNTDTCSKVFHFTNTNPLDLGDIVWPPDIPDAGCAPDLADDSVTIGVTLLGSFCNPIDIISELVDTTQNADGCAVVQKTYTVIDSCVYTLSGGTAGKFTHDQFITVTGLIAPDLVVPADIVVEPTDSINCTADVTMPDAVATGCGLITITNNYNNGGANASGTFPLGTTTVVFTAVNDCGVQTQDSMTVTVGYNTSDILTCPAPYFIPCEIGFDPDSLPLPFIDNVCGTYNLTTEITGSIDKCDTSILTITYNILTIDGRSDACSFDVTVEGAHAISDSLIDWPEAYLVLDCTLPTDPDSIGSFPEITIDGVCAFYSISYEDSIVAPIDTNAVSAIERTWTIIDSCNYDINTGSGIFTFVQHIDLIDTIGPIVLNYEDGDTIYVAIYTNDCKIQLDLSDIQLFDCSDIVVQTHSINGGVPSNSSDASGYYTLGVSTISYYFEDALGYSTNFTLYVAVVDSFPPTWPCPDSLDIYINANGLDTVYARDFSYPPFQAFDNCNYFDVTMTFDSLDLADSIIYLACTGNVSDLSMEDVKVWVFDKVGLSTYCIVDLNVLEPPGQNTDCTHLMGIFGQLASDDGTNIPGAVIQASGTTNFTQTSDEKGRYEIRDIPPGEDLEVTVSKQESAINGVNISDVIAIRDHILGKKNLNTPYKILAADVNNDNYISVRDLLEIRKLILGYTDQYSSGLTWRFADKSYKFANKDNPFNQDKVWKRELQNVIGMLPVVNWVGLKLGDVNNSVHLGDQQEMEIRDGQNLPVYASIESEDEHDLTIQLICEKIATTRGFQFEMDYDQSKLELIDVKGGDISGFDDDNYRIDRNSGKIVFEWDDIEGHNGSQIATLIFKKLDQGQVGESLKMNTSRIDAMAVDLQGHEKQICLISAGKWNSNAISQGKLLQNNPNPFTSRTMINIMLTRAVKGILTVYDATGRVVYRKEGMYDKGINSVEIKAENLQSSGIYLYKFESEIFTDTKKMILTL